MELTALQVQENINLVKSIAKSHKCGDFEFAVNAEEQKTLWSARKESLWSMLALRREGDEVWSTDVAVPISRLPDIIGLNHVLDIDKQVVLTWLQKSLRKKWTTWASLQVF